MTDTLPQGGLGRIRANPRAGSLGFRPRRSGGQRLSAHRGESEPATRRKIHASRRPAGHQGEDVRAGRPVQTAEVPGDQRGATGQQREQGALTTATPYSLRALMSNATVGPFRPVSQPGFRHPPTGFYPVATMCQIDPNVLIWSPVAFVVF